mmetsp:Transcript_51637/g.159134  ORF Transcript_51637/g.159134 Transcript_51637/m.159134 type:complete len:421 (-) Transcript_51637:2286-3548(-)
MNSGSLGGGLRVLESRQHQRVARRALQLELLEVERLIERERPRHCRRRHHVHLVAHIPGTVQNLGEDCVQQLHRAFKPRGAALALALRLLAVLAVAVDDGLLPRRGRGVPLEVLLHARRLGPVVDDGAPVAREEDAVVLDRRRAVVDEQRRELVVEDEVQRDDGVSAADRDAARGAVQNGVASDGDVAVGRHDAVVAVRDFAMRHLAPALRYNGVAAVEELAVAEHKSAGGLDVDRAALHVREGALFDRGLPRDGAHRKDAVPEVDTAEDGAAFARLEPRGAPDDVAPFVLGIAAVDDADAGFDVAHDDALELRRALALHHDAHLQVARDVAPVDEPEAAVADHDADAAPVEHQALVERRRRSHLDARVGVLVRVQDALLRGAFGPVAEVQSEEVVVSHEAPLQIRPRPRVRDDAAATHG